MTGVESMNVQSREFTHPELDQPVVAIGGNYTFFKEFRLPFEDREILCLLGAGIFDTTCCGAGGCLYALVPGFVQRWRFKTDPHGQPVSLVAPVSDLKAREGIKALILRHAPVHQVSFL